MVKKPPPFSYTILPLQGCQHLKKFLDIWERYPGKTVARDGRELNRDVKSYSLPSDAVISPREIVLSSLKISCKSRRTSGTT